MAGCKPQFFSDVNAATFAALQAQGKAAGLPIAGNDGQATTMGVTLRWHYDPDAHTLTVECTDAPFFVPCATVATRVQELIDGCRPQAV